MAWRFADATRLAIGFSHVSNAGIGERNAGTEIATFYYAIPLAFGAARP